jgi:hypothetical protein
MKGAITMETYAWNFKRALFWFAVVAADVYLIRIVSSLVHSRMWGWFIVVSGTLALVYMVEALVYYLHRRS